MKYTAKKEMTAIELMKIHYAGASNSTLKDYFRKNRVKVNGKLAKLPTSRMMVGDALEIASIEKSISIELPFDLIYEDKAILVVNKASGYLTSGEGITNRPTLHAMVDEYVEDRSGGKANAYVVHRLDKEVGGLVLFAKSEEIVEVLQHNWKSFTKKYLALCRQMPPQEAGIIDTWLVEHQMKMHISQREVDGAVRAISHYEWKKYVKGNSLIEVTLETGKKNQIRAHLYYIGCPIIGDRKYGDDGPKTKVRLMASELEIFHPVSSRRLHWKITPTKKFLNP